MRSLYLDNVFVDPNDALSPTALALRTDGVLAEWTSEQNVVYNPAAARGSRIIVSQSAGSLVGKKLRDNADGAPLNAAAPLWNADATLRGRKSIAKDPANALGNLGDEVPIATGQFTIMLVAAGDHQVAIGYDPAGGNIPFSLYFFTGGPPNNPFSLRIGTTAGEVAVTVASKVYDSRDAHVFVVSCTQGVGGVIAHDHRYQPARFAIAGNFSAAGHADVPAAAQPIRINSSNSATRLGFLRIANVAYTEAQCIAWRDALMQYWTGSVVQP